MKPSNSIKVSNVSIETGGVTDPKLQRYATRLRALDKDGNGELDLNEVCAALDTMVEQEKQNRLLKKLAILFGLLSLLTIAAVVGLTAAVIILSKDTQDTNNVLVSKDSGKPMATAQYLGASGIGSVIQNPTPTSLSQIHTLIIPGTGDVNYTVHTVTSAVVNNDQSVTFTLANGEKVTFSVDAYGSLVADNASSGRRLLGNSCPTSGPSACTGNCVCITGGGTNDGGNINGGGGGGGKKYPPPPPPSPMPEVLPPP